MCASSTTTGSPVNRLLAVCALVGTLLMAAPAPAAEPIAIAIRNYTFVPAEITVPRGSEIRWTNEDATVHSILAVNKSFHSPGLDTADSFTMRFDEPGEFVYVCGLHPHMTGKIRVQ